MKFNVTKTYFAILLYTKRADDIGDNPAQNVTLFSDLCHHFKLRKNERGNFRTNLYFAWKYNRNDLRTKVIKQLKSTQDNSQKATEGFQAKVQSQTLNKS